MLTFILFVVVILIENAPKVMPVISCVDTFKYPNGCDSSDCLYQASWTVDQESNAVKFSVKTRHDATSFWSGIGFNKVGSMDGADIILGYKGSRSTVGSVVDLFSSLGRQLVRDVGQSVTGGSYSEKTNENNYTFVQITFQRALNTGDDKQDVDLTQCVKFLYPVWPGLVVDGEPKKHPRAPIISQEQMCLQLCLSRASINSVGVTIQFVSSTKQHTSNRYIYQVRSTDVVPIEEEDKLISPMTSPI